MRNNFSVAIVGGGIGGLAAAASLLKAGLDVHVYERSPTFGAVGAGIQISANASRLLYRLGLGEALDKVSVKPLAWEQRRWDDGRTLLRSPLAGTVEKAFGFPHYNIHRPDLIDILVGSLPAERIHADQCLQSFVDHGDCVEVKFENRKSIKVDALIGADGVHSTVRNTLFGPEKPHFTGCVAYRGLVPAERLKHLNLDLVAQVWMGPGKHFVHYFVRNAQLISFGAFVEQDHWTRESWTNRGSVSDALRAFEGWHPIVREMLGSVEEIFEWALLDRIPMPKWSVGRVTLLGDACHAMLPFMAQGAVQAIEDGATLARCLSEVGDDGIPGALHRYESLRLPRTSQIQGLSETNKRRFHLPDGPQQQARDEEMARGSTDWSIKPIAWIYEHDAGEPERSSVA